AYVTGETDSDATTFPDTVGPVLTKGAGTDAFVARVSAGAVSFGPVDRFALSARPLGVAVADLDQDGDRDLLTAEWSNGGGSDVRIWTNAAGLFTGPGTPLTTVAGGGPYAVTTGDLNGDGRADIVAVNHTAGSVSVMLHAAANGLSFLPSVTSATGTNPISVALADVDGQSGLDLLVADYGGGTGTTVSVFLNTGSGAFGARVPITVGAGPATVTAADLDADGKPDLIVTSAGTDGSPGSTVTVRRNTATPGVVAFAAPQSFAVGTRPFGVTVADLDGDGRPDLAVTNYGVNGSGQTVSVLRHVSTAGVIDFDPAVSLPTGLGTWPIAAADFNGDGRIDLVTGNYGSGVGNGQTLSGLRNVSTPGTVRFEPPATFDQGVATETTSLAVGDLDGDGRPDLAVANSHTINGGPAVLRQLPAGAIRFQQASSTVGEGDGSATVRVVREGGYSGRVTASVAVLGGSTAGVPGDATLVSGTVTLEDEQSVGSPVTVNLVNDTTFEPSETLNLGLSAPTFGATLTGPTTHLLTITDNDCGPAQVAVAPAGTNTLQVTVTQPGGNLTALQFKGAPSGAIPNTNLRVSIGALTNQTGDFTYTLSPAGPSQVFTIQRVTPSGAGTIAFDAVNSCGTVTPTLAGGGANAWPGGVPFPGEPEVPPRGTPVATPGATPAPSPTPVGGYAPGAACATFPSHAAAQAQLRAQPTDPLNMDGNRNGIACEGADGAGFVQAPLDHVPVPRP
ncbi:MAG: FG-GAP-like repeat-containing protein, partial [Chloroflexota bacterium]